VIPRLLRISLRATITPPRLRLAPRPGGGHQERNLALARRETREFLIDQDCGASACRPHGGEAFTSTPGRHFILSCTNSTPGLCAVSTYSPGGTWM